MPNMKKISVVKLIFYDTDKKILLQDRRAYSRWGEEWGYFGGHIEEGENPEDALVREIKEELSYSISDFEEIIEFECPVEQLGILGHMYLYAAPLPSVKFDQQEGEGMQLYSIEEAKKLKMVPPIDYQALEHIENFLQTK